MKRHTLVANTEYGTFSRQTAKKYTHIVVCQGIRLDLLKRERAAEKARGFGTGWYDTRIAEAETLIRDGRFKVTSWHTSEALAEKAMRGYDRLFNKHVAPVAEAAPSTLQPE